MPVNTIPFPNPTASQIEQAALSQADVSELLKRLVGDGFDWRTVVTGASTAVAEMVMSVAGADQVPVHFAQMSALTLHFAEPIRRD